MSAVNPNPTNLVATLNGGTLMLIWPQDNIGWQLQSNAVSLLVPSAWHDTTDTTTTNRVNIPVSSSTPNVFYRLRN